MRFAWRDLGIALHVPGVMALMSGGLSLPFGEQAYLLPFVLTALVAFAMGQALYWLHRDAGDHNPGEIVATMALAWLIIPVIGSIPFWSVPFIAASPAVDAIFSSPLNGLFESFSGFTSTGLTMVSSPSELPMSL